MTAIGLMTAWLLGVFVASEPVAGGATLVAGMAAVAGKRALDAARGRGALEVLDGEEVERRVAEHLGYAVPDHDDPSGRVAAMRVSPPGGLSTSSRPPSALTS